MGDENALVAAVGDIADLNDLNDAPDMTNIAVSGTDTGGTRKGDVSTTQVKKPVKVMGGKRKRVAVIFPQQLGAEGDYEELSESVERLTDMQVSAVCVYICLYRHNTLTMTDLFILFLSISPSTAATPHYRCHTHSHTYTHTHIHTERDSPSHAPRLACRPAPLLLF